MVTRHIFPKLLTVSLILMGSCTPSGGNNPNSPNNSAGSLPDSLNNGLVLYLPFEGNANDLSTNKNNGTVTGNVTFVNGKIGKAASFNGTTDGETSILVKNSDKLSLKKTFSISAWANSNELTAGAYYPVVTKGKEKEDYTMWFTQGGPDILLNWQTDNELWPHLENETNDKIVTNKWFHLVVTYDGSKVKSYTDGALTKSSDFNKNLDNSNEDLYVGISYPGSIEVFKGLLDEVRIYDRALTDSEISALATQK